MPKVVFLCDNCDKVIKSPEDGVLIKGNIYAADPMCNKGLIGDAFPDGKFSADEVREFVLCRDCLVELLPETTCQETT